MDATQHARLVKLLVRLKKIVDGRLASRQDQLVLAWCAWARRQPAYYAFVTRLLAQRRLGPDLNGEKRKIRVKRPG